MTSTTWKKRRGTLLLQLQQWQPCKWQFPTQTISKLSRHGGWPDLPQHAHRSPGGWQLHFFALHNLGSRTILDLLAVPKLCFLRGCICCRVFLAHCFYYFNSGILRVWFPRQAHLPLHGAWRRTRQICHWPWNVESKIEKAELPKNNTKLDCRAMSTADPNPSSTSWLLGQIKRNFNPLEAWNRFAWAFGLSTINAIKTIKETTPTHTLGMPLHDCMHPSCCLLMCVFFSAKKPKSCSSIEHDKLRASFLCTESQVSGAIDVGLKCTDRSRWSLATVTSGHSHGWTQPWSHRNCGISAITSLPLSDALSLIGYLGQNYPCKHFMQRFAASLPDWYVAAGSRTTTSICSEEWCTGVVLAVTSKPICLKS